MSVLTVQPKFLYPYVLQFPFDSVAVQIVKEIEKRNWKVPGLELDFDTYGSGEEKFQYLRTIRGKDFKLFFCRYQGHLNHIYNDVAGLREVVIPRQEIHVFDDESGPRYYLYVGDDWDADKDWFISSIKVNSKLNKKPRKYLVYEGQSEYCVADNILARSKKLIATDDLDREYLPKGDEPITIDLDHKFAEFKLWLEENVLDYILSFPEAETVDPPVPPEKLIPYEGQWNTIYSICSTEMAMKIEKGKMNPLLLSPMDRAVFFGGSRLVPLSTSKPKEISDKAFDGFIWCDVNRKNRVTSKSKFVSEVFLAMKFGIFSFSDIWLVAIKPKYANHIYVVDNAKYENTRQQIFKAIAPRKRLSDNEYNKAVLSRAKTMVPINEYKGGYKEPIVLIGRELDFDEIDYVKLLPKRPNE